ncbi:hypothetical protein ACLS0R_03890 [Comamonas jiangduensis]|uniref:hypothetical protein n=1 Tax=Comamonas jiangduensis TaxID=1194168 RepID=UPI003BF7D94E
MAMHSYSWLLTTRGLGEDISQLLESVFSTLAQEHSFFCDYKAQSGVGTLMRTDTGYELTVSKDRLALNAINLAAQQGNGEWLSQHGLFPLLMLKKLAIAVSGFSSSQVFYLSDHTGALVPLDSIEDWRAFANKAGLDDCGLVQQLRDLGICGVNPVLATVSTSDVPDLFF